MDQKETKLKLKKRTTHKKQSPIQIDASNAEKESVSLNVLDDQSLEKKSRNYEMMLRKRSNSKKSFMHNDIDEEFGSENYKRRKKYKKRSVTKIRGVQQPKRFLNCTRNLENPNFYTRDPNAEIPFNG